MEDNRFEEQAKQVMGDFMMEPSDQVWQAIYPAIQKNKKRRAAFWWFFGTLILLGTGIGIFQFNKGNSAQPTNVANRELLTAADLAKKEQTNPTNQATISPNSDQTTSKTFTENAEPNIASTNSIAQVQPNILHSLHKIKGKKKGRYSTKTSLFVADSAIADSPFNPITTTEEKAEPLLTPVEIIEVATNNDKNKKDSLQQQVVQTKEKEPAITTNKKITDKKQTSKWSIWAGVSGGIHYVYNTGNLLSAANSDNLGTTPGSSTGAPNNSYVNTNITSGKAYQLAIELQHQKTKRFFISAGLAYQYRSLKMATGSPIYTQPYLSFAQGNSQTFNSRMHQLALPIKLYWQINSSKSHIPIYWNLGFTFGKTLRSTTLEYNSANNSYNTKNNSLNNSFATIGSGLHFNISANKKRPIWLGIIGEYHIQPITQSGLLQNKKTIISGISIRKQIF